MGYGASKVGITGRDDYIERYSNDNIIVRSDLDSSTEVIYSPQLGTYVRVHSHVNRVHDGTDVSRPGHRHTAKRWAGTCLAVALVVLCAPGLAQAGSLAGTDRCLDVADLADRGVATFFEADESGAPDVGQAHREAPEITEGPCGTNRADADPSSNVCFEDAEHPISTLPRLLAQWRAEKMANGVVDSVLENIDEAGGPVPLVVAESSADPVHVPTPESNDRCTSNPSECRALPPLPPSLVIDAAGSSARLAQHLVTVLDLSTPDDTRPWAQLRVRPSDGHRDPPLKPPTAGS